MYQEEQKLLFFGLTFTRGGGIFIFPLIKSDAVLVIACLWFPQCTRSPVLLDIFSWRHQQKRDKHVTNKYGVVDTIFQFTFQSQIYLFSCLVDITDACNRVNLVMLGTTNKILQVTFLLLVVFRVTPTFQQYVLSTVPRQFKGLF